MSSPRSLAARDDVDPARLGMTGVSAGGVASLIVAGVDDRVAATLPVSGMLAWDQATTSPTAWQHGLLAQPGLTIDSEEWRRLMELLSPETVLGAKSAAVLLVNGTTDEFFPIASHVATWDALPESCRTALIANFDHGCYGVTGVEAASNIEQRAAVRILGGQQMWFAHHFGTDARFAELPSTPSVSLRQDGGVLFIEAEVDHTDDLRPTDVKLWWSSDDGLIWFSIQLEWQADRRFGTWLLLTPASNLLAYVDVEYVTSGDGPRFALSSVPTIPAGQVPRIRANDTCLAP